MLKASWINRIKIDPWNFFKGYYMIDFLLFAAKFSWWSRFLRFNASITWFFQEEKQQEIHVHTTPFVDAAALQYPTYPVVLNLLYLSSVRPEPTNFLSLHLNGSLQYPTTRSIFTPHAHPPASTREVKDETSFKFRIFCKQTVIIMVGLITVFSFKILFRDVHLM